MPARGSVDPAIPDTKVGSLGMCHTACVTLRRALHCGSRVSLSHGSGPLHPPFASQYHTGAATNAHTHAHAHGSVPHPPARLIGE